MFSWLGYVAFFTMSSLAQVEFTRGQKFQIILTGTPDMSKWPLPPTDAPVWDIDLFDNDALTIGTMKAAGKIVICYFSAGTVEDWRDDARQFPAADVGKVLPEWPNEKWIRTGSRTIRDIMAKRIKIAADKGCDAIDPDNIDGYQNDNGLNLKTVDAINYIQWMAAEAAKYQMKIGLKNSLDIVDALTPVIDFAVNEQCAQLNECERYNNFLKTNKPVFHIEYPTPLTPTQANSTFCKGPGTVGMSTILKNLALDGPTVYCDGSQVDTPTKGGSSPTRPIPSKPIPSRTTTRSSFTSTPTRISSSTRTPTSTPRPTSTPTRVSSSTRAPTSTPGNPGGCKQKHWDQCGGQDWKGCTVCESPYQCKGVSPPWYYQCL